MSRRRHDAGAVAVIVSVVVAFGVLMGSLAISVDVGSLMSERRQLQNGADAAALALAQLCGVNDQSCKYSTSPVDTTAATAVQPLAGLNAQDGKSTVSSVCAANISTITTTCETPDAASMTKCTPKPSWLSGAIPYVEVKTTTLNVGGGNTVLTPFAKVLTNSSGSTVTACSRAAYGPGQPTQITVLSLSISECDWSSQVGWPGATNYPVGPSGAWPGYSDTDTRPRWPSSEDAVFAKGNDTTCDTSSPGGTAPGGFAWLDGITGPCSGVIADNAWVHGDTGANGCSTAQFDPLQGTIVYIPVFDCMMNSDPGRAPIAGDNCNSGSGNNTYYHISGFAAFYLSGWRLTNGSKNSVRPPNGLCGTSNSQRCLSGWFLKDLIPAGDIIPPTPTDPNYGITVVKPAG
ncbi:pilus assembly protein TadG-related protein [Intrasporangium flavum]|uniref:pilus assembly protein TadG-related protein n=1 Tax=Intrasporangium flavum TaxID=1428657 RepID=UPI001A972C6A|nr:pilus assembly protein TadG-related protein [Intrasporangium flavum]